MSNWKIEEHTGYHPETDLYDTLTNSEVIRGNAIVLALFVELPDEMSYQQFVDISAVLSWKAHEHMFRRNSELEKAYTDALNMLFGEVHTFINLAQMDAYHDLMSRIGRLHEEAFIRKEETK